jgi:predicted dehydrogenase
MTTGDDVVRLGIVGAGVMGANHARVAARTHGLVLTAVVDADADRRERLAASTGATAAASLHEIREHIDAVVISTPTATHLQMASEAIALGLHVLVEKPITPTAEEGRELVRRARDAGVILTVGHIERFNPAVRELMGELATPIHLDFQRIGPFTPRVVDDVVTDLMVHDLDLARALARSEVAELSAITRSTRTSGADLAIALLTFENGVTASLTSSRISQQKLRRITVTQDESVMVGDLVRQDVMIHRMQHVEFVSDHGARIRQSGIVEIPFIENRGEPLLQELQAFRAAIGGAPPAVDPSDAIAAVELAERVRRHGAMMHDARTGTAPVRRTGG